MRSAREHLGCQIWLEPDDPAERVDLLFARAAESGLGWARIFLMWPWIEPTPGVWRFDVFDQAFDAAARHGIRIKATLTANSGPWHIGTPSVLHSHTGFLDPAQDEPMRRYIQACVGRYAGHPALGQWLLWNEPCGGHERTSAALEHWRAWLRRLYPSIGQLNERWRTGYPDFDAVPFPEDIPHPAHRDKVWNSYGPWLADWQARAAWLNAQLTWIRNIVRELDPRTETCVNPTSLLMNQAADGTDLAGMGAIVDIVGASYHPAWHFTYAGREQFPALMVAGVRLQAAIPSIRRVEVTEVQAGNTLNSGNRPGAVTPAELARFYLASLAAGAESVTGWCLNTRSRDFEAGDWGLLDDLDRPSERSRMLRRLHDRLEAALAFTGGWSAAPARAWVGLDPRAQAIEWIESRIVPTMPGRLPGDGAHGAGLLAAALLQCGIAATPVRLCDLPRRGAGGEVLVLSHLVAWDAEEIASAIRFAESGGTLLIDATSGRKDTDARLHRPWPGGLAERLGLRAVGLESQPQGYDLLLHGLPAGRWLLARLCAELDPSAGWFAWPELRFAHDGQPCVWERPFARGRVIVVRGMLGPSLVHAPATRAAARHILAQAGRGIAPAIQPVGGTAAIALPVMVEHGELTAVFAPDALDRGGAPVRVRAQPGAYRDLWSGAECATGPDGELALPAEDGIALLWRAAATWAD